MLNLTQAPITFKGTLTNRSKTNRIIVHHSASDPMTTPEQIHGWHLAKGWSGIGYHFVIQGDGAVWTGRPIGTIGAHAYNFNTDSVGICVCGDFTTAQPSEAQMVSLVDLIKYIKEYYQTDLTVQRHRDVNATACPGNSFPWDNLLARLTATAEPDIITRAAAAGLIANPEKHKANEPATKEFVLQVGLNIKGGK